MQYILISVIHIIFQTGWVLIMWLPSVLLTKYHDQLCQSNAWEKSRNIPTTLLPSSKAFITVYQLMWLMPYELSTVYKIEIDNHRAHCAYLKYISILKSLLWFTHMLSEYNSNNVIIVIWATPWMFTPLFIPWTLDWTCYLRSPLNSVYISCWDML